MDNTREPDLILRATPATDQRPAIRVDGMAGEEKLAAIQGRLQEKFSEFAITSDRTRRSAPSPVRVGISNPITDPRHRHHLVQAVRSVVEDELGGSESAELDNTCICIAAVPGYRIGLTADDIRWRDASWNWIPPDPNPNPGNTYWTIALLLDDHPWQTADGGRLILEDWSLLGPRAAQVQLHNETKWAKEIWADNLCSGQVDALYSDGTEGTPTTDPPYPDVTLCRAAECREGTDTLVFRKPGFFGVWTDYAHFPPELFWQAFGGTLFDFTWTRG